MKVRKSGISLMILVITIIVIIILAGAVILSLTNGDTILRARKTAFLNDLKSFQNELEVYKSDQFTVKSGRYNSKLLQANDSSVTYDGTIDNTITIYDLIPGLDQATKYHGRFEIVDGKLVYIGTDTDEKDWSGEIGVDVADNGPKVTFTVSSGTPVTPGTDIVYTVIFTSGVAIPTVDLTGKVEVLNVIGKPLSIQPAISIGIVSGTGTELVREVAVTITTDNLTHGGYRLKIKAGSATDTNNDTNTKDVVSPIGFAIDNAVIDDTPPANPTLVASPTSLTNGNVMVTITYSPDTTIKEYTFDEITWNTYLTGVTVSSNNTIVYARGTDDKGNQSGTSTIVITNIDKQSPSVAYETNGASNVQTASTKVTVSDANGVNAGTLQYVWDTQNATQPSSGWTSFTNGSIITKTSVSGTYYLWIKGSDNAGNSVTAKSNTFVIDNTAPTNPTLVASPTSWTNGNVLVTITYSGDTTVKEYSLNGTTWNTYTSAITVTSNGTVYARGKDVAGNQSGQASLTVANIDKLSPTVAYGTNGASNVQTASTVVTVSDTGGSDINESTLQYVWDIQNITEPSSGWALYFNNVLVASAGGTGTYYLWIKGADNAGNTVVSKSNAFVVDNTAPTNPTLVASPTSWTNGNVLVTITYSGDTTVKEYSLNGTTWNTYTSAITVTSNGTVYARGKDAAGNQSGQASLTVANIEKVSPTVAYGTNGASNVQTASTVVTVSDTGGSSINASTLQYVWDTQNSTTPASGWTAFTNGNTISKGNSSGTYYLWIKASDNAGNSLVSKTNAFTFVTYKTYNGGPYAYNNPVIPDEFTPLNTTDASWDSLSTHWNNGLVIQDAYGNQYVWVPVDGSSVVFQKWCQKGFASYDDPYLHDYVLPTGISSDTTQVTKYGGFYIGRYEARYEYNGGNIRASIRKSTSVYTTDWSATRNNTYNGYLWNWITCADARTYAEAMITAYGYTSVKTGLVTGAQWDTTLKWIDNSGKSAYDGRTWGNHIDSTYPAYVSGYGNPKVSGYSEYWKAKNIYDLSGNFFEWTNEFFSSDIYGTQYIVRGGPAGSSGANVTNGYPAANRIIADLKYADVSFRTVLYVL